VVDRQNAEIAKILPHLKRVATLPCEIFMSENKRKFQTVTVINYRS